MMRDMGIRTVAYPLDWVQSPFSAVCKVLEDDFKYFLTNLKLGENRPADNKLGIVDHYGFYFMHDWPTTSHAAEQQPLQHVDFIAADLVVADWEEYTKQVRDKYNRRIERFRQTIQKAIFKKETLYFIRADDGTKEDAIYLRNLIRKLFPKLSFVLLAVKGDDAFRTPWNLDGIENFYISHWNCREDWDVVFRR